ncbi:hypothetical protein [Luteimonas sp. MC1572]|uniref:hypothetical protein n=1 Tax=Luteimonas sp. MC1572 TaxID=2799325 RepID=UPI0018F07420|nr:hypothetical protein [Luteimonas sp. MC1572]MBJ6981658.1 hypothetical protein [Luteimonas sp. MC1572]QQO02950.1 hypothetical protein JGR64_12435 [Luteimonas sp. MC1572]
MNAIQRRLAAGLLVLVTPIAVAQRAADQAASKPATPATPEQAEKERAGSAAEEGRMRSEIDRSVDAIRTFSAERRAEALANARRGAEELDRQIQRLDAQLARDRERMGQSARTRAEATMADLRQRRNTLAEWYGGLRHAAAASWSEVRSGFVKTYHELSDTLGKARGELKRDDAPARDAPPPVEEEPDDQGRP